MNNKKINLSKTEQKKGLFLLLLIGIFLFIWQLGSTGLFDETPPLFAAAARRMHLSGDWITPRVNGLNRFDKPPLIYWIMGLIYALPGQASWDPLGTWAARLPSAISSLLMMLFMGQTLMAFPQNEDSFPRRTAFIAALGFALSPLVVIWSRIAVSDALLCSTLGISFLLQWRRYSSPSNQSWWLAWVFLSFSVLTKGPVAIVLMGMVIFTFGLVQADLNRVISRIKPIKGLFITFLISAPWYLIELLLEGKPFWDSFFGYHNLQRLTSVVNGHQEPWWFFGFILIIASLPLTPYLIIGIYQEFLNIFNNKNNNLPNESLSSFAFSWLFSVLILFTFAATKLPSYWLPATPAAAILIAIYSRKLESKNLLKSIPFLLTLIISLIFSLILLLMPLWIKLINDPEIPNLASSLISSMLNIYGAILIITLSSIGLFFSYRLKQGKILLLQVPYFFFHLFIILPLLSIGDQLRQLPLREVSSLIVSLKKTNEQVGMVGIRKPSLHFYTNNIIFYESNDATSLVNLSERLRVEKRNSIKINSYEGNKNSKYFILVIDEKTSNYNYWKNLNPEILGQRSIYKVWRVNKKLLYDRAQELIRKGVISNWQRPRPERI